MTTAIVIMGGLGLIVGIGLAIASKIFYVFVDPLIESIEGELPGANCGGCGYPGCSSNAEAIAAGKSSPNSCVAAGIETAQAIAALLGVSVSAAEPDFAQPGCSYGVQDADTKYRYDGLSDCRAVALLGGGMKVCTIGCLGLGTCVRACPFDAIHIGPNGLPVVNEKRCTGCGTCERACPKNIINLSSVTRRILREYTREQCTTPCQRACPAGIDICEYIRQIDLGDYHRAVQVIKERNPFPTVIGRICPRPCENQCRRNLVDESVAINFLKRFAADYERRSGQPILPYKAPATDRKIAVIGGGVEGLSAAFFSARLGHSATVFEATGQLGGLLRTAISIQRLPAEILDWDIQGVKEMGVSAQTNKMLGVDFTLPGLLEEGYHAVMLATGGWDSRMTRTTPGAPESPVPGTHLLLDYIKSASSGADPVASADSMVIVGGGKLALEAAKLAQKAGARNITLLLRDRLEALPFTEDDLRAAGLSTIRVMSASAVLRILGEDERLTAVECLHLGSGQIEIVDASALLLAAGRFPEMIFGPLPASQDAPTDAAAAPDDSAPKSLQWEGFAPYKPPDFKDAQGLFSQGDQLTDFSGAIKAIAAGRRAAASIHKHLYDIPLDLPQTVLTPETYIQNVDHVAHVQSTCRQIMPLASPQELATGGELEKGFDEQRAKKEAARCLRCGLICYQHTASAAMGAVKSAVNA